MPISVSVIVAVYNAELHIARCLNSIANQTLKNIEVILVDDGSTDSSGKLCDDFAAHDSRFRIFHKSNEGVGLTREFGTCQALGQYMIHVDPDDWIESTMLEELYDEAVEDDIDVLICNFYEEDDCSRQFVSQFVCNLEHEAVLESYLQGNLHGSCCNKLVKCSTWFNLDIHFPHINFCEDLYVNVNLALFPIKFSYIDKAYYHYIHHAAKSNLTNFNNPAIGDNAYKACIAFRSLLLKTKYWKIFIENEMSWLSFLVLYQGTLTAKEYKEMFGVLKRVPSIRWDVRFSLYFYHFAKCIVKVKHFIALLWCYIKFFSKK